MIQPYARTLLVLTLVLLTVACPQKYRVRLKPGSTSSTLTLLLDGKRPKPVDMVEFTKCGLVVNEQSYHSGPPVWSAHGWELPDSARRYAEISYGQQLAGFAEKPEPAPLSAGCYVATVLAGGSGTVALWIDSLGNVKEWTKSDYDSASTLYRSYAAASNARADTAIALCLVAYKSAATAQDSVSVDKRIMRHNPKSEALSCRDYRRLYWSDFQKRPWAEDSTPGGA